MKSSVILQCTHINYMNKKKKRSRKSFAFRCEQLLTKKNASPFSFSSKSYIAGEKERKRKKRELTNKIVR